MTNGFRLAGSFFHKGGKGFATGKIKIFLRMKSRHIELLVQKRLALKILFYKQNRRSTTENLIDFR